MLFIQQAGIDTSALPAWGRVYNSAGRQVLVWIAPEGLEVIDITGLPIAGTINQADYHTADESFINNVIEEISQLPKKLPAPADLSALLAVGVVLGVALVIAK